MEGVPPPAQYKFVPFQEERLKKNGGLLLEAVVQACARAVAILGAARTTLYTVKGKEVQDSMGRIRFRPLFQDRSADTLHMPSLNCAGCSARMQQVGVLCTVCKSLPVRLRAGPPLVDFAWEGSGRSAEMGEVEQEAMLQADQVFHFAVDGIRFGKTLAHLSELAVARGSTVLAEYPNVALVRMDLHRELHFQYTVILDKKNGEEMESVSNLMRKRVHMQARHWLSVVEGILNETQNNGVDDRLDDDDQRRIDRTCAELADLIAAHVAIQDDEMMHNRLYPVCLEKKALCEFVRCSSSAMDRLRADKDSMTKLLQAMTGLPGSTLLNSIPSELTDFMFEHCPPELSAVLPGPVSIREVPCQVFANFLVEALRRLAEWKQPRENSVCFQSTVIASQALPPPGVSVLPAMEWCHLNVSWIVRRWPHSNRTGLDATGVRIVRLISAVWGMHAAGAFEPGTVHAKTLYTLGEAYASRAAAVREWAVQVLQPTMLRAKLVDAKSLICREVPEVENDVADCVSAFSNLALDEVMTLTSPASPMYNANYWRIADMAASMMSVRLPQEFYRDFVRVILPMVVAHLGEKRFRRGMTVSMRSSWLSDILFLEPAVAELVNAARSGKKLSPIIFLDERAIQTSKGRNAFLWLCKHPGSFVRKARIGIDRVRGFEVIVNDLFRTLYLTLSA